jgi:hypothetical protein
VKPLFLTVTVGVMALFSACQNENTVEPTAYVLVQGTWQGTLDSNPFDITFIEGEFEGGPTLAGSAHLIDQTQTVFYLVMNGTHNRRDTVWFSLYEVPVVSKEDYHLKGAVSGGTISGTYEELSQNGIILKIGTWQVKRFP